MPAWDHSGHGMHDLGLIMAMIGLVCFGSLCSILFCCSGMGCMGLQVGNIQHVGTNLFTVLWSFECICFGLAGPRRLATIVPFTLSRFACCLLDFLVCCSGASYATGIGVLPCSGDRFSGSTNFKASRDCRQSHSRGVGIGLHPVLDENISLLCIVLCQLSNWGS